MCLLLHSTKSVLVCGCAHMFALVRCAADPRPLEVVLKPPKAYQSALTHCHLMFRHNSWLFSVTCWPADDFANLRAAAHERRWQHGKLTSRKLASFCMHDYIRGLLRPCRAESGKESVQGVPKRCDCRFSILLANSHRREYTCVFDASKRSADFPDLAKWCAQGAVDMHCSRALGTRRPSTVGSVRSEVIS